MSDKGKQEPEDYSQLDAALTNSGASGANVPAGTGSVFMLGDTQLIEVAVDDEAPIDDNASDVWSDMGDSVAIGEEDDIGDGFERAPDSEAIDMAIATFRGHSDCVYSAAVHPSLSNTVLTGGGDDTAYLWTYDSSGAVSNTIQLGGHKDTITSVGFNFDGTLCLTGSYDGTVRVWRVSDGSCLQTLEGPEDVEFAYWHSKGNAIVAGSKDGTIWMWLAHSGQCVQVFAGHDGAVTCGAFSSDGKWVLSGGEDGSVRVWAPKTGLCRVAFDAANGHDATVTCIAGSADGDLVLSGSADGTVKLFQISGKRLLQTFKHSRANEEENAVGESAIGGSSMKPIKERNNEDMDAEDGEDQWEDEDEDGEDKDGDGVECVGFSAPEYRWLASGGMDKTVKIWDLTSGSCRSVCSHEAGVISLAWHTQKPIVVSASLDRSIRLWDARSGVGLMELTGHTNLVTNFALRSFTDVLPIPPAASSTAAVEGNSSSSSDGLVDVIVSVSDDNTAKVFHVNFNALLE